MSKFSSIDVSGPTEEELRERITRQLAASPDNDIVVGIWMGYLMALLEFSLISIETYANASSLLPRIGLREFEEFLGLERRREAAPDAN